MLEINWKIYLENAKNGARELMQVDEFRILTGIRGEHESVFLFDDEEETIFIIDHMTAFEFMAQKLAGVDDYLIYDCIRVLIENYFKGAK